MLVHFISELSISPKILRLCRKDEHHKLFLLLFIPAYIRMNIPRSLRNVVCIFYFPDPRFRLCPSVAFPWGVVRNSTPSSQLQITLRAENKRSDLTMFLPLPDCFKTAIEWISPALAPSLYLSPRVFPFLMTRVIFSLACVRRLEVLYGRKHSREKKKRY